MTPKQMRFVEEYVRCRDKIEAAREAGYSPRSRDGLRWIATQVLWHPEVIAALRERGIAVAVPKRDLAAEAKKPLSPHQRRFVAAYAETKNAAQAAREAGYSGPHGRALLQRPNIAAALKKLGVEIVRGRHPGIARVERLTPRQERFVREYLIGNNATEAARRAGLSRVNPNSAGQRMLNHPLVADAIERGRAASMARTQITRERTLLEYARLAYAELGAIADWDGETFVLKSKDAISAEDRAAIGAIVETRSGTLSAAIDMRAKLKALDALARYLGLFEKGAAEKNAPTIDGRSPRDVLREKLQRLIDGASTPDGTAAKDAVTETVETKKDEPRKNGVRDAVAGVPEADPPGRFK
jgi:phage terminase small subunit